MSLYGGSETQYVCPRCHFRMNYKDTVKDPNNQLHVCAKCKDVYDPWRKPARKTEKISLNYPRTDDEIAVDPNFPGTVDGPLNG